MIRKKKNYVRPRQIFEAERIKEENKLVSQFGLKNKTEIWKTQSKVDYYRGRAKALAKSPREEQETFFGKLRALGLKVEGTADVLGLKVEDLLQRRLPTIVTKKKLANTPKHARQLVVHHKVIVDGNTVSSPSYLVPISEEDKIKIKKKTKKVKPAAEEQPAPEKAEEKAKEKVNAEAPAAEETKEVKEEKKE